MTAQTTAGRPRLRELRSELGWTQQLADEPAYRPSLDGPCGRAGSSA
ncbi:MAG: hypothetical protein ACRDST_23710 [Pseudonocardiaceae bacterium]